MSASATDSRPPTRDDRLLRHRRIVDRYVGGDPITEIATDEGICVKTVRNVARRNDVPRRRPDRRVRDARIAARYAAGDKVAIIAAAEGVSRSYVRVGAAGEAAVWLGLFDGDGSGGAQRNHGRPRIDWFGGRRVMEQCTAFWAVTLSLDTAPAVLKHGGGLSTVALHGITAARAAQVMLDASPVSQLRKRLVLEEIANYRPLGRRVRPRV